MWGLPPRAARALRRRAGSRIPASAAASRRHYQNLLTRPIDMEPEAPVQKPAWADHAFVSHRRGKDNTEYMDHFFVAQVMDRLPAGSDPAPPPGPLTWNAWLHFYDSVKDAHPMPITEWIDEWFPTEKDNPYLRVFAEIHTNAWKHWNVIIGVHGTSRDKTRYSLYKFRSRCFLKYSPVVPSDVNLNLIEHYAAGRGIVEVQARLGYWTWMMRQHGLDVAAYDDFPEAYTRHASNYTEVRATSGEREFEKGMLDHRIIFCCHPQRPIEGLDRWQGDTVIHVGPGAVGGHADIGAQLINLRQGWQLVDFQRVLFWPMFHDHLYVFMRGDRIREMQQRERGQTQSARSSKEEIAEDMAKAPKLPEAARPWAARYSAPAADADGS